MKTNILSHLVVVKIKQYICLKNTAVAIYTGFGLKLIAVTFFFLADHIVVKTQDEQIRKQVQNNVNANPVFDHHQREYIANDDDKIRETIYIGPYSSQQHPSVPHDLVKPELWEPDTRDTANDYLTVIATSLQAELELEDVDYKSSTSEDSSAPGKKRSPQVPVPPAVESVAPVYTTDDLYVNVKNWKI